MNLILHMRLTARGSHRWPWFSNRLASIQPLLSRIRKIDGDRSLRLKPGGGGGWGGGGARGGGGSSGDPRPRRRGPAARLWSPTVGVQSFHVNHIVFNSCPANDGRSESESILIKSQYVGLMYRMNPGSMQDLPSTRALSSCWRKREENWTASSISSSEEFLWWKLAFRLNYNNRGHIGVEA